MMRFSIVVPTWKNVRCLDLCYKGIVKNSAARHEVIVFFNEYDAECAAWLEGKDVLHDKSDRNLGVCAAVNRAAKMATSPYLCFMNDDMYALPDWDTALAAYLGIADTLWLSGTAVEPRKAARCYIGGQDYGTSPADFQEERLLREYAALKRPYNMVSTWTPMLLPKSNWDAVGGFDENYFPGYGSDPDLAMKMFKFGCRHFIGVGSSLVYHFSRSTISRFDDTKAVNEAKEYFRKKWGMTWKRFLNSVIYRDEIITDRLIRKIQSKNI